MAPKTPPKTRKTKTQAKTQAKAKSKTAVKPKKKATSRKQSGKGKKVAPRKSIQTRKRSVAKTITMVSIWGLFMGMILLAWFSYDLPSVRKLAEKPRQPNITLLARNGERLTTVGAFYGEPVVTTALPKHVVHSFLATEDRRFFDHFGIDVFGLMRAFYRNLRAGRVVQGGSTITQQLAKNFLLTQGLYTYQDRSLRRKVQELILSLWLEMTFTKHQILTIYVNRVYFGSGAFGLGAASKHYFDKSPTLLSVYESAMLAGLLKAPSKYSPHTNQDAAHQRTSIVLKAMVDAGFLTEANYHKVKNDQPILAHRETSGLFARYFIDWIVESIPEKIGPIQEDVVVTTTLDVALQSHAESVVRDQMLPVQDKLNVQQASLISMTSSGSVRAMVGGIHYAKSQYNRSVQAYRQTGSVYKYFVFLAALENQFHPDRKISDQPIQIGKWSPKNYGWKSRGDIAFQDSFAYSVNTATVRLAKYAGWNRIQDLSFRLGLSNPLPPDMTVALGTGEATLLEMTGAYAHVANDGYALEPNGIVSIQTLSGKLIYKRDPQSFERVISESSVQAMRKIMNAVMNYGTGRRVALKNKTCYGKSGTTQNYKDAWFIGFDSELVTGVWCGNDDNQPMKKVTGAKLPGKIWHAFMTR